MKSMNTIENLKKHAFSLIFGVLAVSFITSCGVGLEDSSGPNADRIIKNEKNQREYNSIKGVYVGQAMNPSTGLEPFPAKLSLYIDRIQDGVDSDLQPTYRIVLRGRLQRLDFVGDSDNLILTGNYDAVSGRISLEPPANTGGTPGGSGTQSCDVDSREPIAIRGVVRGNRAELTVTRDGRIWAFFEANLQTREVISEKNTDSEANLERLRETYRLVQGTYVGDLERKNSAGETVSESVKFILMIVEAREGRSETGEPCFRPRLNGRFLREKAGDFDDVSFTDVRFFPDRSELKARRPSNGLQPAFELRASTADGLQGRLFTEDGYWGDLTLKKASTVPTVPGDSDEQIERDRLVRTYSEVVGRYIGRVTPDDMTSPWPVEVTITMIEEQVGTTPGGQPKFLPALRARYRRPDFSPGIGDRFLVVRYSIEGGRRQLFMTSTGQVPSPIPGAQTLSITATFDQKTNLIAGSLADHRGNVGRLEMRKPSN